MQASLLKFPKMFDNNTIYNGDRLTVMRIANSWIKKKRKPANDQVFKQNWKMKKEKNEKRNKNASVSIIVNTTSWKVLIANKWLRAK